MIKWDDLTIRVTLPDGTKQQSHARVTNFSSRKNWLIEAEEVPTLEYGCTMDTDELEKWINSYPAGSVVVTKRKKEDFPYKYFNPAEGWFGRKDLPDDIQWYGEHYDPVEAAKDVRLARGILPEQPSDPFAD